MKTLLWIAAAIAGIYLIAVIIGKNSALYKQIADYIGQIGSNFKIGNANSSPTIDPKYSSLGQQYYDLYCTGTKAANDNTATTYYSQSGYTACSTVAAYLKELGLLSPAEPLKP